MGKRDKYTGSGVFVNERVILTAGHVLYSPKGLFAAKINVTPGGSLSKFQTVPVTGASVSQNWTSNLDRDYDYGVICIGESQGTGYLGMSSKTDTQLKNISLVGLYGYPGETDAGRGTLWYSSGKIDTVEPLIFSYTAKSGEGFSGGPVVNMADYGNTIGIHVANNGAFPIATRITSKIIRFVEEFEAKIN